MSETTVLHVQGMSCGHCKAAVEKAVKGLNGVSSAEVDLAAGKVSVTYDAAKTSLAEIKAAIEEAGYEVV